MTGRRIHRQDGGVITVGRPVVAGRHDEMMHADQAQGYQGDDPDHKRTSRHADHYHPIVGIPARPSLPSGGMLLPTRPVR